MLLIHSCTSDSTQTDRPRTLRGCGNSPSFIIAYTVVLPRPTMSSTSGRRMRRSDEELRAVTLGKVVTFVMAAI
ncbi:conserved hypothetical protein [Ricinus communis]|uniref:Uncharacterized protein n=1 Tax=Ricinus communis TaxID=3988 RepID=B9T8L3_RICCO|nr:conserved hypothetical protein [Ricinus communis]